MNLKLFGEEQQKNSERKKIMHLLDELNWRGLLYQQTDAEKFYEILEHEKITIYCGFDPTADSLHVGHLVPYQVLNHFHRHGHKVIVVVGGGTGRIGDPGGRSTERNLLNDEEILFNTEKIKKQILQLLDTEDIIFVDNNEWLSKIDTLTFLRDYGKYFNLNTMLAKETVQSRLEVGISYTEFSYQVLQAIDFYTLFKKYNCNAQLGGSDQWGNIVSGVDFIRKKEGHHQKVFGMTLPLIKKADGKKFGKSESGAIWLDAEKTSPYDFYQFWLNTTDLDALNYLKIFTFLTIEEITEIERVMAEKPELRAAQKALAEKLTLQVHGSEKLEQAQKITMALFSGSIQNLSATQLENALKGTQVYELKEEKPILDALIDFGIIPSKRQGREFIQNGALRVNGEAINDEHYVLNKSQAIDGKLTVIRKGKKHYSLIRHVE